MNTGLASPFAWPGFDAWQAFVAAKPDFDIAAMMKRAVPGLSDAELPPTLRRSRIGAIVQACAGFRRWSR